MDTPQTKPPVVVTYDTVESIFRTSEALGQIDEARATDASLSAVEKAAAMAMVGNILTELEKAHDAVGGRSVKVLATPHDAPASRLQSLIASGEGGELKLAALPAGGFEATFDTGDWAGWAKVVWEKLKNRRPHPLLRPAATAAEPLTDTARVVVFGDWGTGLYGAPAIARSIAADPDPFAMLLHLGDVYYSGTPAEVDERFLDLWPRRPEAVSRALNSNHEMYSGGHAYFGKTLPAFGQEASYFACQNRHWTLVGLDVAHRDHAIDDEQVAWLESILAQAGDRRVVLFSHHQLYSHFESQGDKLAGHPSFGAILRSKRIFAWYWGHEHRCTVFEDPDGTYGLYGRCIGHAGMPQARDATIGLPRATGKGLDRAEWRRSSATVRDGIGLPGCLVLDGRNDLIPGEEERFSPHGYAVLTFDGPTLTEEVRDAHGAVIYARRFGAGAP